MKTFLIAILSLFLSIAAFGQQPSTKKIEYIIYGKYCGMCNSHCALIFKLENNILLFDTAYDYFKKFYAPDSDKRFAFKPVRQKQEIKPEEILDSIPAILYKSESKTFGEPDNRDQCGIFLQIKTSNKLKTFYIDTDLSTIPIELRNYASLILEFCYIYQQ